MKIPVKFFLCISSAILLANSNWLHGLAAWFCLVPVFIAISGETQDTSASFGAVTGLATGAFLLYGIALYGILYYLVLIFYCGLNGALISRAISFIQRRAGAYSKAFIVPSIWVSFEYLRTLTPISFPLNLGTSQFSSLELIQIASIFGTYVISFIIVFGNCAIFQIIQTPRERKGYVLSLFLVTLLVFSFKWGDARIKRHDSDGMMKRPLHVAVVQGSIPIWFYENEFSNKKFGDYISKRYLYLIKKASKMKPTLIVTPEVPINRYINDADYRTQIAGIIKNYGGYILLGAPAWEGGKSYNSAFLISPSGDILDQYRKSRPVPLAEEYISGGRPRPIGGPLGKFGIAICFESIYPALLRGLSKNHAECLFILTNDANFGYTAIPYLHTREAIFRAVENGRWVVRAAQNGISMLIDPLGRVIKKTILFEQTIMTGTVDRIDIQTPYARLGDIFVYPCLVVSLLSLLHTSSKKRAGQDAA